MQHSGRHALAALTAVLALALGATITHAGRLSFDDADFKIIWPDVLIALDAGGVVVCNATFLGTLHSTTVTKVANSLIGNISLAEVAGCDGGTATILQGSLPWPIAYESFRGTLPRIIDIRVRILGMSLQIRNDLNVTCLLRTSTIEPGRGLALVSNAGQVATFAWDPTAVIDTVDVEGILCDLGDVDASLEGLGAIEDSTGNLLFVRLI